MGSGRRVQAGFACSAALAERCRGFWRRRVARRAGIADGSGVVGRVRGHGALGWWMRWRGRVGARARWAWILDPVAGWVRYLDTVRSDVGRGAVVARTARAEGAVGADQRRGPLGLREWSSLAADRRPGLLMQQAGGRPCSGCAEKRPPTDPVAGGGRDVVSRGPWRGLCSASSPRAGPFQGSPRAGRRTLTGQTASRSGRKLIRSEAVNRPPVVLRILPSRRSWPKLRSRSSRLDSVTSA